MDSVDIANRILQTWTAPDFEDIEGAIVRDFLDASDAQIDRALRVVVERALA